MFDSIYVPVDNSEHSNACEVLGVQMAQALGAKVAGSHVYAAALHDTRFKQMEFTLPEEYKEESELEKQRRIHDALITRGLQLISDSYLDRMQKMAADAEVEFERLRADGRNFEEIVREIDEGGYALVLMGALGQGAVRHSTAGSVCERTLRRVERDVLVVRSPETASLDSEGAIVVALDGSPVSWGALKAAIALAQLDGRQRAIEVVAVADPAAEELLEAHLRLARTAVREAGRTVRTTLLEGDPGAAIIDHVGGKPPWMLVLGRSGIDSEPGDTEVGSVTWQAVRRAACNVLVSVAESTPSEARQTATAEEVPAPPAKPKTPHPSKTE